MRGQSALVGRQAERPHLEAALERARRGQGSVVLMCGEAGVGKTRLAAEITEQSGALVLLGGTSHSATPPYGPIVAALRSYLRSEPAGLEGLGVLGDQLALILPELGEPPAAGDRPALFEAVRFAFARAARDRCIVVILDDLQWSDEATLEMLSALAQPLGELSVLVIASYRSDGLSRDHGLRRLRNELRRAGLLDELALYPLSLEETTALLAQILGRTPSPSLVRAIHDRTEGIPFFIEELAAALRVSDSLKEGRRGLELVDGDEVPLPRTVRDAVLIGTADLSDEARAAVEVAAVAGESFDVDLVIGLSTDAGFSELVERGLIHEQEPGRAGFRHALTCEAIYADVPWIRRRTLHGELAEALDDAGAQSREVALHWLGARDSDRARSALVRAAADSEAVNAYRDAAAAGRQALELWPESIDDESRSSTLERYARCCELAGELAEATRAWGELCAIRGSLGQSERLADAQRRLAAVHELRGDRDSAFAARRVAAEAYAVAGRPAEAAVEHLAMANQLRLAAKHGEASDLARKSREEADLAGRRDLHIRALGLEGLARAKQGDYESGLETVRAGLALALEHDLTAVAAELYQRLSVAIYEAADYRRAEEVLDTALELCRATGDTGTEVVCVSCLAYVLRERGEWSRAASMSRELIASGTAVFVAEGLLGSIHCYEGKLSSARRLLSSSLASASRLGHYNMTVDGTSALARLAAAEGDLDLAGQHCRALLARWEESDDHHYAVSGLRWAAGSFAVRGDAGGAHACSEALSHIASHTGHVEALAALAHAIAETALLDGDTETAADQLSRAVELHGSLDIPFERAQIELRAGVALTAAGEREAGLERLCDAYRAARKLGARPLAAEAAREVGMLGESVVVRLGRRAAADVAGGLSRREVEVVRMLALGSTNREIAQELFLSQRTVDMHVRNILRKLDCRSRVEAAHRAREIGLLA